MGICANPVATPSLRTTAPKPRRVRPNPNVPWADKALPDRERQNVMLMANLREAGMTRRVRVTDISPGGAKVRAAACVPVADDVLLELPGLGWIGATIAWAREQTFGVTFHAPIDPTTARQKVTGSYTPPPEPPRPQLRRVA